MDLTLDKICSNVETWGREGLTLRSKDGLTSTQVCSSVAQIREKKESIKVEEMGERRRRRSQRICERKEPLWRFLRRAMKPLRNDKNSTIRDRFSEAQRMLHGLLQAPWKSRDDRRGGLAMKVDIAEGKASLMEVCDERISCWLRRTLEKKGLLALHWIDEH